METIRQDIRYAARTMVKAPGFTVVAVLTLAIGIGANTAIFSVVQAALLRSLPYPDADRLVYVSETSPESAQRVRQGSHPDYLDWKEARAFDYAAAYQPTAFFVGAASPERVAAARITADFFKVLGISPILGRHFTSAEENSPDRVAIITHGFWQRQLGSDATAVGRPITLSGAVYTIAGVLPAGFHFAPAGAADIWVPLNPSPVLRERRFTHWLWVIGRLKDGITIEAAQPEFTAIGSRISRLDERFHAKTSVRIGALSEAIVGNVRPIVLGLFAAVGLVLLIACANVANLVLARSAGRRKEIAIRIAVGANRVRLAQQLLTETLLLSLLGGVLGLFIAHYGLPLLIAGIPEAQLASMPFLLNSGLDLGVLTFTVLAVLMTGVICGFTPALQASGTSIRAAMAPARFTAGRLFIVSEIATALVLLIAAGLLVKSTVRLLEVDPGFNTRNLLTLRVSLWADQYRDQTNRQVFYRTVLERIAAVPGVIRASGSDLLPLTGGGNTGTPSIEGMPEANDRSANLRTILPGYFDAMDISLLRGRDFSERDAMDSPNVVIVNETFVSRILRSQEAVGKRLKFAFSPGVTYEIVGVVGDENVTGLDAAVNPVLYYPNSQVGSLSMGLVVRTNVEPSSVAGAIRSRIAGIDPTVAVLGVRTMDETIAISPYAFSRRYPAMLIGMFAAIALLLASIGIYGVIACSVTRRTREMGIRLALGAQPGDVFRLVLREGAALGGLGMLMGLVAAGLATRFMSSLLFGVGPMDPVVFASSAAIFMAVTLLACYVPARRATRVDPLVALREQ